MKKTLLIAALAAFTMTSCSKDQVVETPQEAIKFSVVADKATKASNVWCNNFPITEFNVWASYYTADTELTDKYISYFANDLVTQSGPSSSWVTDGITRYWPAFELTGSMLTFYALAGTTATFDSWADASTVAPLPTISDYTVAADVEDQEDVLYSRSVDYTSKANKANLNFRHALSLIEFQAKNSTNNLHVKISNVCVGGVFSTGDFTFPVSATSVNYVDHADDDVDIENENNSTELAKWENQELEAEYIAGVVAGSVNVSNNKSVVNLTVSSDPASTATNSMLLLPQEKAGLNTDNTKIDDTAYMGVYCEIYNMAGDTYAATTDVLVYRGWALVPVTVNWDLGKKYIYTFNFVDGNGGIDGGNDPENPEPGDNPVLFTIDYNVTVDDFDLVLDTIKDMKK